MNTTYRTEETLNAVLYILAHTAGRSDMHKIFKTLYFADAHHLSRYGRSITGDTYIAMNYGPVPSLTFDIFKAVRGDSFFADKADDVAGYFHFVNKYIVQADRPCDTDCLSDTDTECLDEAAEMCRGKNFAEITQLSHGLAWQNTSPDRSMSVKDILREQGDTEAYAGYVADKLALERAFC